MASRAHYINLARQLPPNLQRFFARYPPASILPSAALITTEPESTPPSTPSTPYQADRGGTSPFRFWKHPVTGKWQDPIYSLRRQADLLKLAREHGVEELLPQSEKGVEVRAAKRVTEGLQVKGTGVGQRVKGHIHERMMNKKWVASCTVLYGEGRDANGRPQNQSPEKGYAGYATACGEMADCKFPADCPGPRIITDNLWHRLAANAGDASPRRSHPCLCEHTAPIYVHIQPETLSFYRRKFGFSSARLICIQISLT